MSDQLSDIEAAFKYLWDIPVHGRDRSHLHQRLATLRKAVARAEAVEKQLAEVRALCEPIGEQPPSATERYEHGKYVIASRVLAIIAPEGNRG
jgi:hypothetical protein